MDWFERITGFREDGYDETRNRLEVVGKHLRSRVNGKRYAIGDLELVSLDTLRNRVKSAGGPLGRLKARVVTGDVRPMHSDPAHAGALFQVASQFNLLEMTSSEVTPEQGVTCYQHDDTQGPACAIAAGAATIYRNYFVPVDGGIGQTRTRQIDGLAGLGEALNDAVGQAVESLWEMRNGYALCTPTGLDTISKHLDSCGPDEIEFLRGTLRIGLHRDVEVTEASESPGPLVSQTFCSALPVAYTSIPQPRWRSFATLVLEAAYEATILSAVLNARRGVSNVVLLTRLGGGAFGNDDDWIHAAMRRALGIGAGFDLDVTLVSYGMPSRALLQMAGEFS